MFAECSCCLWAAYAACGTGVLLRHKSWTIGIVSARFRRVQKISKAVQVRIRENHGERCGL